LTYQYTRGERQLSNDIRKIQRNIAYHRGMIRDLEKQQAELKDLLNQELISRGIKRRKKLHHSLTSSPSTALS